MKRLSYIKSALILACLVGITLIGGCKKVRSPHCTKDSECASADGMGVGVCIASQCQDCVEDTDCKDGARCNNHRCELPCSDTQMCLEGFHCDSGFCKRDCKIDEDCDFNMSCVNKRCEVAKAPCSTDMDCEAGYNCVAGLCSNQSRENVSCTYEGTLHFDFDKSMVKSDDVPILERLTSCLKNNPAVKVSLEGYTDNRGTTEYNLALGQRRAESVKTYMEKLGVLSDNLNTISYGKEKPILPQANEKDYAENRRVVVK